MYLLGLLAIPLIIGFVAMIIGKGELTWREFIVQEVVILVLVGGGYGLSVVLTRWQATDDTEIWNGRVASKKKGTEHCCHSYPCNPHPCMCDSKGNCSTCWDTCYQHSHDVFWSAKSTNSETIYYNGCNAPGTRTPTRWEIIKKGEPTSFEHSYTNYIKANPESIMRRTGASKKFPGLLPGYPRVFDHYRANEFVFAGLRISKQTQTPLSLRLREINASLGARKQLNLIIVVAKTDDLQYIEALKEHWLGGKKNDLVVVVGAKSFPEMDFVGTVTWSRSEEMKLAIRDRIMELKTFDGDKVLDIVEDEAKKKFQRQPMSEYEYLMENVEPPLWVFIMLLVLGLGGSVGMSIYFIRNDPFGADRFRRYHRFY